MTSASWRGLLRRTVRLETAALRQLPNVTHVTLGEKFSDGTATGRVSIKAHVRGKADVRPDDRVPKTITVRAANGEVVGEIETDVVETGAEPEGLGLRAGHLLRAFDNDRGITGLTFKKGAAGYALTNAHVACDIANGAAAGVVSWEDGATLTPLGPVIFWTPLRPGTPATADAAVVRLSDPNLAEPLSIAGVPTPISRMDVVRGAPTTYWFIANGERFECADAEPADGDNDARVDGVIITYRGFWQLRMTSGLARKGLSGSLRCRTIGDEHVACGLLFGGLVPNYIWVYPFRPLYERIYNNLPG